MIRAPLSNWRPVSSTTAVQALLAFVKEQQDSLLAAWHGEDAGTEELRLALQGYRAFGTRLADFSRET